MASSTFDSGVFPVLGIRADRKTPAPWSTDGRPAEPMLGDSVWSATRTRSASASLRVVREEVGPDTGWASPPPIITRRAMLLFQLGLAGIALLSVFVF